MSNKCEHTPTGKWRASAEKSEAECSKCGWYETDLTQGMSAHSNTPSWEAEFDQQFASCNGGDAIYAVIDDDGLSTSQYVKRFIQSLLAHQQAEAVALGESLKRKRYGESDFLAHRDAENAIYNEAITTYQEKIKSLIS